MCGGLASTLDDYTVVQVFNKSNAVMKLYHLVYYCRLDPRALGFQYKAQALIPTKALACKAKLEHAS